MRELIKQLEALKRTGDKRHAETMAKFSALRAEYKNNYREVRESSRLTGEAVEHLSEVVARLNEAVARLGEAVARLNNDVQRVDLRSQSQMEGLEAVLRSEIDTTRDELTMLYSLVKGYMESKLEKDELQEDDIQSCLNKIRSLELRVQELEARQAPAA